MRGRRAVRPPHRARLAVLENRKADGLAFYQLALQTRTTPPAPWHGKLQDNATDEARALWRDTGGTEVAWNIWSNPPASKPQELAEGRWYEYFLHNQRGRLLEWLLLVKGNERIFTLNAPYYLGHHSPAHRSATATADADAALNTMVEQAKSTNPTP